MAASDFETLVTKIMTDDGFASALVGNPAQALAGAGVQPTPEMLDALKGVDVGSLRTLASTFKAGQAAAS